ncbi:DNA repair protein RAD50 [Cryptosporidium canis]|uniref:DNA repair protein RAD50 n=1 Tax=Cryptosporidium canis TaxID=195482 RepID=A0ABQ8P2G3_9CRYT|nr:DNA repair protein RAD50 [Cryptosporidium canis]KAJ1612296.1 DNA repair protein RAD50 [Cryptosporidium canis]
MSCLEKLVICGVRSFSPDRREGIAFEGPITLIVGQNGSGKTTIIECLKASVSGELPPNSKSGQYFVHDPKLNESPEVRAQIRLIFREYQNRKKIQVVRSFQLSHIKARKADSRTVGEFKPQFKVLESVLQTKDEETGQVTSISHKCADINTQVPVLFGVSNSIIENVLFCHQEDSNWPLQDMAKVKKKFDELFGSTRYSKALEYITKLKTEYNKKIKEKALFNENLKQKIDFLEGIINKKNQCIVRKEEINRAIQIIKSQLESRIEIKNEMTAHINKLDTFRGELSSELMAINSYEREIIEMESDLLSSKYKEIKDELEIDSTLDKEKKEIKNLNSKLQDIKNEINNVRSRIEGLKTDSSISEFNQRKNDLIRKINDINAEEISEEISLFLEGLLASINEKLVNYENIRWEIVFVNISEIKINDNEESSLVNLKEHLSLKMEEKEKAMISLGNKKDEQANLQRELDRIDQMIKDKGDLYIEMERLKTEIKNNKDNTNIECLDNPNYLENVYDSTYSLGVINGELNILERIRGLDLSISQPFEYDQDTNNFDEMIERRKTEYGTKKAKNQKNWEGFKKLIGEYNVKNGISILELHYKLLLEKLDKFPCNLEEQHLQLKNSLNQTELELLIIDENLERIESESQEITHKIQMKSLEIKNLENANYKKKEYLTNSIKGLKRDFDFLFANRMNFEVPDQDFSNKNMIQSLFEMQEEEARIKNEITILNQNIGDLNNMAKLSKKKKQLEVSKNRANSIINETYSLLGKSQSDYSKEDILNDEKNHIQEIYLQKKNELDTLQIEIEKIKCELSKLNGEYEVNEGWLNKFIADSNGFTSMEELSEKYHGGVFEQRVMSLCVKDMEKYHKSLQKALMKFHVDKMTEINRTIKELWNVTYKGHDIDYIAIRSDAEDNDEDFTADTNQKSSRSPSGTKSFNYRVVMIQNGVELDMKGRCSAGQKVLACIIIRLALAESFCVNCGVLALDEPTTNLDRFNIKGLAEALSYLIKFRKQQKNFQLIIITHDENFVRVMAQAQQCDHFFHVSKDEQGYSTIRQVDFHGF